MKPRANSPHGPDQALREAVLRRLSALDRIASASSAEAALIPLARTELTRLASGWRRLLAAHQPDHDRKCTACPRSFWRRRWPCRIWLMAHQHLIGESIPRPRPRFPNWFHPRSH